MVTLMPISGAPRVDGSAVLDIVLQLLLPFAVGQALRPSPAPWVARHTRLIHAVDRGSILLIVYAAFSVGMAEHIWTTCGRGGWWPSRRSAHCCWASCWPSPRSLARLDRGDAVVLLFCGSKKSLAGSADGAGAFPARECGPDHVAAHAVSPDPAVRLRGDRQPAGARLVAADVDRVGRQQRQRQRLAAQHPRPQVHPRFDQNV